ncbi:MAG: ribbon-helix-helix domain-containing protein [Roseburia hominis]|jgi:metal-responsive CopG/Arc/MetJ family transcriptional regulator|uniref:ribbon-helix-helix domain-containing protein n=1 Tax=Roseburia hominis TaxID=301301 RepID=UPI002911D2E6|nr:ribbon-helix-helix domain-containing protein [Roseburia hominis]MDU6920870.1 ribbon-helix-helix domain-containing protein [Roseburia hominis]
MAEEKPSGKASTRAKNKYNAKTYDQFLVTVPAGQKEIINTAAKEQGYNSRNEFIVKAINEKIQHYQEREVQNP